MIAVKNAAKSMFIITLKKVDVERGEHGQAALTIVGNAVVAKKDGGNVWAISAVVGIMFYLIQVFSYIV